LTLSRALFSPERADLASRSPYGAKYRRQRAQLLDPPVLCAHCQRRQATEADHDPPLAMHVHREGSGCCRLIPSCTQCNREGGKMVALGRWRPGDSPVVEDLAPERAGVGRKDPRWDVPWLRPLRRVPRDATWPRLMTVPHPRAVGSLGAEFVRSAQRRSGRPLRWWQRLVAVRLLEVDDQGRLVWEAVILTLARQLGKSWLLREICLWRMAQGDRFGEPQDILHTGRDLTICKEVQRVARIYAKQRPDDYRVREVNGQEEIELLADGSRWMLRAKEATYGYSVSGALVDEAWKVRVSSVEEGLTPTMAEREQPQLWLVSTAHRMATSLMLGRRALALEYLETGEGDLLIEWSAPRDSDLDDVSAWRLASPYWTSRRERMIRQRLDAARSGETDDPDEPDPIEAFRAQWLNQWPRRKAEPAGATEDLLEPGLWDELREPGVSGTGELFVAIEDDYGLGAAVAAARVLEDGRLEVDGWLRADWDSAIVDVVELAEGGVRQLVVGSSLLDRIPSGLPTPVPAGGTETRKALAVFRDLAAGGRLAHDSTTQDLDMAVSVAQVREAPSGLFLAARGPTHLIRAVVWAVAAADRPAKVPAIY
jgi:hypothetical protein